MKAGDRIRLICMVDDPDPIPPGTTGTVHSVVEFYPDLTHINVDWDIDRSIGLVIPPDIAEVIDETG